jgi:hypothetical protein
MDTYGDMEASRGHGDFHENIEKNYFFIWKIQKELRYNF